MFLSIKRALRVLAAIIAAFVFYTTFFFLLAWLDSAYGSGSPVDDPLIEPVFFFVGLFFPLAAMAYLRHERRRLWIREEAERWLAERATDSEAALRNSQRRKMLRKLLWVPSLVALSVFSFLPESMGLVSHLFYPSAIVLNGHRIRPPLTSYVFEYSKRNRYMDALIGRGIARGGFLPYWRMTPPLSFTWFYAQSPSDDLPLTYSANETATVDRTLHLGDETISCWRISSDPQQAPKLLRLHCRTSKNDFSAGFAGSAKDASVFYQVLEGGDGIQAGKKRLIAN